MKTIPVLILLNFGLSPSAFAVSGFDATNSKSIFPALTYEPKEPIIQSKSWAPHLDTLFSRPATPEKVLQTSEMPVISPRSDVDFKLLVKTPSKTADDKMVHEPNLRATDRGR